MAHQRLLVFMGSSQEEVRFHKQSADVTTDEHGRAMLQIPQGSVQWIQVFADSKHYANPSRTAGALARKGIFKRRIHPEQLQFISARTQARSAYSVRPSTNIPREDGLVAISRQHDNSGS